MSQTKKKGIRAAIIILLLFVITRSFFTWFGLQVLDRPHPSGSNPDALTAYHNNKYLSLWGRYDSKWYMVIAKDRYPDNTSDKTPHEEYSFFPLYPYSIDAIESIAGIHPFVVGLFISNLSFLISAFLLYRYYIDKNEKTALFSAIVLFASPVSFLFSSVLTESVLLLLCILFFTCLRQNKFFQASLFAGIAVLCRPTGVFLLAAMAVFLLVKHKPVSLKLAATILLPSAAAVILLMLINQHYTGNCFTFLNNPGYKGQMSFPLKNLFNGLTEGFVPYIFLSLYTIVAIVFWVVNYKNVYLHEHLWIGACILIPLSYGLMSMPRMILMAFPIYYFISKTIEGRVGYIFIIGLFIIQVFLFRLWVLKTGYII